MTNPSLLLIAAGDGAADKAATTAKQHQALTAAASKVPAPVAASKPKGRSRRAQASGSYNEQEVIAADVDQDSASSEDEGQINAPAGDEDDHHQAPVEKKQRMGGKNPTLTSAEPAPSGRAVKSTKAPRGAANGVSEGGRAGNGQQKLAFGVPDASSPAPLTTQNTAGARGSTRQQQAQQHDDDLQLSGAVASPSRSDGEQHQGRAIRGAGHHKTDDVVSPLAAGGRNRRKQNGAAVVNRTRHQPSSIAEEQDAAGNHDDVDKDEHEHMFDTTNTSDQQQQEPGVEKKGVKASTRGQGVTRHGKGVGRAAAKGSPNQHSPGGRAVAAATRVGAKRTSDPFSNGDAAVDTTPSRQPAAGRTRAARVSPKKQKTETTSPSASRQQPSRAVRKARG